MLFEYLQTTSFTLQKGSFPSCFGVRAEQFQSCVSNSDNQLRRSRPTPESPGTRSQAARLHLLHCQAHSSGLQIHKHWQEAIMSSTLFMRTGSSPADGCTPLHTVHKYSGVARTPTHTHTQWQTRIQITIRRQHLIHSRVLFPQSRSAHISGAALSQRLPLK